MRMVTLTGKKLKTEISPCCECLVKMCCGKVCNEFIIYYVTTKKLVKLELIQKGINPATKEGYKTLREIMLKILHDSKNTHISTMQFIDDFIYNYEEEKENETN
jgi:hypothetical protein